MAVTQITDSLYVKQGAKITRLYTDSAALRTMTLSGSPIGTPGDSCMFLNLGVPVHCTKAQVLAWLGSSGITSINTGTAAAHTIVGEQGLQVLDSGTNLYKHVIIPATGYIIPTGSNMRVDSTTLADSAADAGKWGGNVYGGPYLGLHATADTAIAADRARKLATTRTIGKSTTFDGTANIVPDSAVSVVQATQLTTARTIGNTSFNGTANIIPDTCNKANRARYADSSGATHKADTSISSHQSAQLTTAVNIGNVSFNGTAAIIPDTANKANRARYSDSTGKIPDTIYVPKGIKSLVGFFGHLFGFSDSTAKVPNSIDSVHFRVDTVDVSRLHTLALYGPNLYYGDAIVSNGPSMQVGVRGSQPLDAVLEVYNGSSGVAHFHNTGAQGASGGAAINLSSAQASAMTANNRLGCLQFAGSFDATMVPDVGADISGYATETWNSGANGSKIIIHTVPNGSTTRTTALTINQDQTSVFASSVSSIHFIGPSDSSQGGTFRYAKTDAINGLVKSNGSGTYSAVADNSE